ncbi:MAG: hypothetical protein GY751_14745, partial [Bacteroidetes bacterium]|nr:hypothetical protein [Bacteroidota bacterium]
MIETLERPRDREMTNPNDIAPQEKESPDYFDPDQDMQIALKAAEIIGDTELLQEALDVQIEDV